MSAACCSTGVTDINSGDLYIYGLNRPATSRSGWFTDALFNRGTPKHATKIPSGGFRPMLVTNMPAAYMYIPQVNCAFCDSIPFATTSSPGTDTVTVWSVPYSNVSGSKPIICAYTDGNGAPGGDSLQNALTGDVVTAEGSPAIMLYSLAALDSAAGHTLMDRTKLPLKIAIVIEAANSYTSNRAGPGIPPQDSSVLIATIDSLSALNSSGGVKLYPTVAINVAGVSGAGDSLNGTGAYSKAWLNRWRALGAKFTPQPWAGILSEYRRAAGGVGDVFGFRRNRFFVGDFDQTAGTKDTSLAQQLKWAKRLMVEAGVDPNEMSSTIVAPLWDWAPANRQATTDRDSALYAFRLAGYTTVVSDANLSQSWPKETFEGVSTTSATYRGISNGLMGYTATQGIYRDAGGGQMKVLASSGHDITGGTMMAVVDDSSGASSYYGNIPLFGIYRTIGGLLTPGDRWNADVFCCGSDFTASYFASFKDKLIAHTLIAQDGERYAPRRSVILRLTTADLAGCSDCVRGAPARNGWWIIKSLKNWMDAVNNAYGGTVVTFDYPENIAP